MNKENVFPTLYDKDSFGNIKTWDIKAVNLGEYSEIVTLYGRARKIEKRVRITEGKNIGKSNETDHNTQAIADAESKFTKKQGQGYFKLDEKEEENGNDEKKKVKGKGKYKIEDFQDPEIELLKLESKINNKLDSNKNGIKFPMLAKDYHKEKHKVVFPCKIQPKLDGYRAIYDTTTKNITSRTGKATFDIIKESPVLYKELSKLEPGLILDGELYIHNAGEGGFEALGVLRKKPKKITDQVLLNVSKIEYHIYDIIDTTLTFKERNKILKKLLKGRTMLKYVETYSVENEDEIKEYHGKFISENYEGTIVRNSAGLYKDNSRSSDLLKYKDFMDAEFKIVDFSKENNTTGKGGDLIVWIVQVKKDILCKVRPKGTVEERQELYKRCVKNFKEFKGRNLCVKFFEKTADGNLRFPTTLRNTYTEYIRDEIL